MKKTISSALPNAKHFQTLDVRKDNTTARVPQKFTIGGKEYTLSTVWATYGSYGFITAYTEADPHSKKVIAKTQINDTKTGKENPFEEEINLLSQLSHPNIIQILAQGKITPQRIFMVLEYMSISLVQFMGEKKDDYTPEHKLSIVWPQLKTGLDYLHQKEIVHGDINPKNILLNDNNILKITDFGNATTFDKLSKDTKFDQRGTLPYLHPELVVLIISQTTTPQTAASKGIITSYPSEIDFWSAALILQEIVTGKILFYDRRLIKESKVDQLKDIERKQQIAASPKAILPREILKELQTKLPHTLRYLDLFLE